MAGDGRGSSTVGAAFNILCTVVGTGLLNLPAGFSQSGWIGAPLLVIMCCMAGYTARVLIKCLDYVQPKGADGLLSNGLVDGGRKETELTYGDIGHAALGTFGRWFVAVQMHLTLIMVAAIYMLLAALNIMTLFPHVPWLTQPVTVLIISSVAVAHVFLKTLSEVAALSYVNITINLVLTVVVITAALMNPPATPPSTTFAVQAPLSLGKAFASFGFAFGVHPILPSIYHSMAHPANYGKMVVLAFGFVMLFYLPMATVGYGVYGDAVLSPVYETPQIKESGAATNVAIALITAHLVLAYPLVLNPPETALENALHIDRWGPRAELPLRILLRCGIIGLTALVGALIKPQLFGALLDLVSSFTSTFTVFILPCVFWLKLHGRRRMHPLEVLILLFSIVGATFGTIGAVQELMELSPEQLPLSPSAPPPEVPGLSSY